jgi:CHAT domain-containing protein
LQSKYNEAEPLLRQALASRLKAVGPDHRDLATSFANLATNLHHQGKNAEAEPLFRKALAIAEKTAGKEHPETAMAYNNLASNLDEQGRIVEAEPYFRQALDVTLKALRSEHPAAAVSYNNLANNLHQQGRYAESESLLRKALAISIKALGQDHPQTATCYNSLGSILQEQGQYAEAEPLVRQALASTLKALGPDNPETATSYNNLGTFLHEQGKYAEAEPCFRRALAILLKALGADHARTATSFANLASNLGEQGKLDEAELLLRQSQEIRIKVLGADHPDAALNSNNLACNLLEQGKYEAAEPLLRNTLAIRIKVQGENHPDTTTSYSNLGFDLEKQSRHAEAEPLLRKALAIRIKVLGMDHHTTAASYSSLARNLDAQGRRDEALRHWEAAVAISERIRYSLGSTGLERSLNPQVVVPFLEVALALADRGQPRDAWNSLEAGLARGLLDDLSARLIRPLTPRQRERETDLGGRLQALAEQIGKLAARTSRTQVEDQRLDDLRQQEGALRGQFVSFEGELENQYRVFAGKPATLEAVQAALEPDTALVGWVDTEPRHEACLVRRDSGPIWVKLPGTGKDHGGAKDRTDQANRLRSALRDKLPAWRTLAAALASQRLEALRPHLAGVKNLVILPSSEPAGIPAEVLVDAQPPDAPRWTVSYAPSGSMFTRLARPRPDQLGPARLLALGDPAFPHQADQPETPPPPPDRGIAIVSVQPNSTADLCGIGPGDVLLEYNGIKLTTASDLVVVRAETGARRIPVKLWRNGEVRPLEVAAGTLGIRYQRKSTAAQVVLARRAAEEILRPATRGDDWLPLPGTRREIEAIAALFPTERVTTLLGSEATEANLQRRALGGGLKTYRFLHLATHGHANPSVAMSSALILAPDPALSAGPTSPENDGRITAQQIVSTWDLDADLVVLSACESGLGRYAQGEGYLGFAQALLVKGARSVVLSQWKVDDQATALLMRRFYENLLGRREGLVGPLPKARALHEAKAWLRGLSSEQVSGLTRSAPRPARTGGAPTPVSRFDHPYYWAGFILIGDPN